MGEGHAVQGRAEGARTTRRGGFGDGGEAEGKGKGGEGGGGAGGAGVVTS